MPWTINSTRIFVDESKEEGGQIIPRLQPLSGGTVLQTFGWEATIRVVHGLVVGDTDKDAILNLRKSTSDFTLMSPEGSLGGFKVKKVTISRIHCICQTIRTDLAENSPVYEVEMELYE